MPSITSIELAKTVARAGCERAGAARAAFTPRDTTNAAGTGKGPLYYWRRNYPTPKTWTLDKR